MDGLDRGRLCARAWWTTSTGTRGCLWFLLTTKVGGLGINLTGADR